MDPETARQLRALPSVDSLLADPSLQGLARRHGSDLLLRACRDSLQAARARIQGGESAGADLPGQVSARLQQMVSPTLRPLINGTGVVIHTNLGRAPLSEAALAAIAEVGAGYSNLEYDEERGSRGSRYDHVGSLLAELSGAEAGLVVNNNAAALVLALGALAAGREVVISRAHLVEIGGGFRIPDIMQQSGARLHEVGTTNRTYVADYSAAVGEGTALFLRVHPSNFRLEGFVHQPPLPELAAAAHERGCLLVDDLGSGALLDTSRYGLEREPMVQESVAAGTDLVLFSGDKLLGGPQAGCLVGRREIIARLRRHPLARALRVDKVTLAALDATLRSYQRGRAVEEIPVWQMIARPLQELDEVARRWAATLNEQGLAASVRSGNSTVGGGSLPGETLPTTLLALDHPHPDRWAAALRAHRPALIPRIENERLLVDPRTVLPRQEAALLDALVTTQPPA